MDTDHDQNKVFINDEGIVEVIIIGDQTETTFKHIYYEAVPLIEKLRADKKPVLGLVDMSQETSYSLASDKAALELIESVDYDKLAMCNAPHFKVTEGIIMATGRSNNTKLFKNRDDALAWLHAN